ncbi:uncharacterized protein LOC121972387 [Zingiber officinale]|uniref:uncharacterized protein LOC121972387 n=1 Tax=Zingiber officinale TaxID=94328 RepID=UPI001C4CE3C5|nr:uncharacterized protein LOC121972387 [Zingiber officinale]
MTSAFRQLALSHSQQPTTQAVPTAMICGLCFCSSHTTDICPLLQQEGISFVFDHVAVANNFQPRSQFYQQPSGNKQPYDPFSTTYNLGWRDHPNLKYGNPYYQQPYQQQLYHQLSSSSQRPAVCPLPQLPYRPSQLQLPKPELTTQRLEELIQQMQLMTSNQQNLERQIGQMATSITQLQSQGSGQLPSQIVLNPKGNVSVITLRSGKSTGEVELTPLASVTNSVSLEQETEQSGHLPFPQRSVEIGQKDDRKAEELRELVDTFSKVEVNIPLLKVIKHILKYAKFLKDLCVHKRKLKGSELVSMGKNVSALIQMMPQKCKDPGVFTIPCVIGDSDFGDAMLDLGALVNVMLKSIFEALCIGPLQTTGIVIQLTNRSLVHPVGVIEDVLVKVKDLIFPADFYILDMEGNVSPGQAPLILGRPFLKTARTKIDVHAGTLTMEFGDTIVQFNILDAM